MKVSGFVKFHASKAISIVRNPIDALVSWAHLLQIGSHSVVPIEKYHEAFPSFWKAFIVSMVQVMKESHRKVTEDIAVNKVPTYFIRYEDLVLDPEPHLIELF